MKKLNESPLVSIVIPVYNVLPYLDECMGSILSQPCEGVEIILVDDGSTDGSGEACDAYSSDTMKIKVVHKSNGGLASARNTGLEAARGAYVSFVDSDDRIAVGAMGRMVEWASGPGADVCILNCEKFFPDGTKRPFGCAVDSKDLKGCDAEKALETLSRLDKFPDAACIKLYRRSFLESNGIAFPDDGRFSEDLGFAIDCFLAARSFDALDSPFYEYRQGREGSITSRLTSKHFFDLVTFVEESVAKLTDANNIPMGPKHESCLSFVAYELAIMTWMLGVLDKDERKSGVRELERFRWVMPYGRGRKAALTRRAVGFLGFSGASRLLSVYMRLR